MFCLAKRTAPVRTAPALNEWNDGYPNVILVNFGRRPSPIGKPSPRFCIVTDQILSYPTGPYICHPNVLRFVWMLSCPIERGDRQTSKLTSKPLHIVDNDAHSI